MTVGLIFTLLLVSLNNKIARVDLTGKWLEILCLEELGFVPFNAQAHLHSGNWIRRFLYST